MHLHFLGICGTFMGSLALLARELGHEVSGCDENVYPPMSTQLEQQGIELTQGYGIEQFLGFGGDDSGPDLVIIGNALSRGNPAVEYVLDKQLRYCSGPQWLSENLLNKKWVLAVAGTHGKTTTTNMLAWILESAGYQPGFLIGGVPSNFDCSARVGESDFFVIEADEYDTAFFDKRSKFLHYHPRTLVMNNLEFDHADIFDDLAAIQKQFHHLIRLVPSLGLVIYPQEQTALQEVIEQGVWAETAPLQNKNLDSEQVDLTKQQTPCKWFVVKLKNDGSEFVITYKGANGKEEAEVVSWQLIGDHNIQNAFSACVAAHHVGVPLSESVKALAKYENTKRRLEQVYQAELIHRQNQQVENQASKIITIYDDFAHHPSAIKTTLEALRNKIGSDNLIAVLEPRSNTMKMGFHGDALTNSCEKADAAYWYLGENKNLGVLLTQQNCFSYHKLDLLLSDVLKNIEESEKNTHIVIMSNGGFLGFQTQLINALKKEK